MPTRSVDSPSVAPPQVVLTPSARRRDRPVVVFRGVVLLVVGFVLSGPGGVADLLAATPLGPVRGLEGQLHRWHAIDLAGHLTLLTVGSLAVAAWHPRRGSAVVQTLLASLAGFAVVALTMPAPGEVLVPVAGIAVLLVGAFPRRRDLLRRPDVGIRSRMALVAALVPMPFLAVNLWQNLDRQLGGSDPHALLGHWAGGAALALALLVTGIAVATIPSARRLAPVVAVTLGYLGVSALVHGDHDGAWASWGAVTALAAAVLFLLSARTGGTGRAEPGSRSEREASA